MILTLALAYGEQIPLRIIFFGIVGQLVNLRTLQSDPRGIVFEGLEHFFVALAEGHLFPVRFLVRLVTRVGGHASDRSERISAVTVERFQN